MALYARNATIVKKLWSGDVEHKGEFWEFPSSTAPQPIPCPPIWVAARSPITYDYAIKNSVNVMSWPLTRPLQKLNYIKNN